MALESCARRCDGRVMTDAREPKPFNDETITNLSRLVLEGDRRKAADRRPPPSRNVRPDALLSLRGPAIVLQVLFAAWLAFGVAAIVVNVVQRSLLERLAD